MRENLLVAEVRNYLETRPEIVQGGVASYVGDEQGVTTLMVSTPDKRRGFAILRNFENMYDIHEFWDMRAVRTEKRRRRYAHNVEA